MTPFIIWVGDFNVVVGQSHGMVEDWNGGIGDGPWMTKQDSGDGMLRKKLIESMWHVLAGTQEFDNVMAPCTFQSFMPPTHRPWNYNGVQLGLDYFMVSAPEGSAA